MGGGGGGKFSSPAQPPAPVVEPPKVYEQEKEISEDVRLAREDQLKKARAALGQEGTIKTSPFGTQPVEGSQRRKTLLGG